MKRRILFLAFISCALFWQCLLATESRILGTVKDISGNAIKDVSVYLYQKNKDNYTTFASTLTGFSGNYSFALLPSGTYWIYAYKEGYLVSYKDDLVINGEEENILDLVLLKEAKITGIITLANGSYPEFGHVTLEKSDGEEITTVRVNSNGRYEVPKVYPDKYRLSFTAGENVVNYSGYLYPVAISQVFEIDEEETKIVDYQFTTMPGKLTGKITGGVDTTGIFLFATGQRFEPEKPLHYFAFFNSEQEFNLGNLPPGNYDLYVCRISPDSNEKLSITVRIKETNIKIDNETIIKNYDLSSVENGNLSGKMVNQDNQRIADVLIKVINQNGEIMGFGSTDADGNYFISYLLPGSYTIEVNKEEPKIYYHNCRTELNLPKFKSGIEQGITVFADQTTSKDFILEKQE